MGRELCQIRGRVYVSDLREIVAFVASFRSSQKLVYENLGLPSPDLFSSERTVFTPLSGRM